MKLLSMLSEVIFQVIIFSLLPFLWWFFTARRKESFFSWIGLKAVKGSWPKVIGGILFFFLLCLVSQLWWIPHLLPAGATVQSSYAGMGWSAFPSAFLFGIIQTGLSEEILFRGFLAKRLISRFGFATGNLPQGLVFGLLHGAMFFLVTTLLKALIITLITGFSDGWQKKQQAALSFPDGWFTESGICCSLWQRHSDCCDRQGGKVIYTYFPCITLPPCTACLYVICPVPFPGGRSFSAAQACPLRPPPSTSFH